MKTLTFKQVLQFTLVWSIAASTSAFTVSAAIDPIKGRGIKVDLGRLSGHEEITRQAMNFALQELEARGTIGLVMKTLKDDMTDLNSKVFGTKGGEVENPIIRGNFATDVPAMDTFNWEVDLKKYYEIPASVDWHTNSSGQTIHFLRNHYAGLKAAGEGTPLQAPKAACEEGRDRITSATIEGFNYWKEFLQKEKIALATQAGGTAASTARWNEVNELKRKALFMFGHATHILQDSFSPAHALRATQGNYDIADICFYNPGDAVGEIKGDLTNGDKNHSHVRTVLEHVTHESDPNELAAGDEALKRSWERYKNGQVCMHQTFDLRDGIWNRTELQYQTTKNAGWEQLEAAHWASVDSSRETTGVDQCSDNYFAREASKQACMKHDARLARAATIRYFTILVDFMINARKKFESTNTHVKDELLISKLQTSLYEGNNGEQVLSNRKVMSNGVLRCGHLSSKDGVLQLDK